MTACQDDATKIQAIKCNFKVFFVYSKPKIPCQKMIITWTNTLIEFGRTRASTQKFRTDFAMQKANE